MNKPRLCLIALLLTAGAAQAGEASPVLAHYAAAARQQDAGFSGFSSLRGAAFYRAEHLTPRGAASCSTCHGDDPRAAGKARTTGKLIEPLAPAVNPQRFTDLAKAEKWFGRNCRDVLQRECSTGEKGDFIAWLASLK